MATLSYEQLRESVAGAHVALRVKVRLKPAGGAGDKVFPPTYGVENSATTKYAEERRVVDGEILDSVLLDSVASQANRMELALLEGWEAGELPFPNPFVDFTVDEELADLGRISALEAPHRLADAIFRDSLLDNTLFRLSDVGRAITDARPAAATALLKYCPTALLFGMWDSTGPKGGLGSKFQRAMVSEIVGYGSVAGVKVGSRIDPLSIELKAGPVFRSADPSEEWTIDENEAAKEKGKPVEFDRKGGQGQKGRPSMINHGNVTPSIDKRSGGVTVAYAEQTTVLSLAALRRLRFPVGSDGAPLGAAQRPAEILARTAVAALGVAAIAYQLDLDYDLRSRCLLIPEAGPAIELLGRDGSTLPVSFDRASASALVQEASQALVEARLGWHDGELRLVPAPKLLQLVRKSRELSRAQAGEE